MRVVVECEGGSVRVRVVVECEGGSRVRVVV